MVGLKNIFGDILDKADAKYRGCSEFRVTGLV